MRMLFMLITFSIFIGAFSNGKKARQLRKRVKITQAFLHAMQDDSFTNEQIMKDMVVDGAYFKDDSVRNIANEYLNLLRQTYKEIEKTSIEVLKYADHEDKFEIIGVRPLNDVSGTKIKRVFWFYKSRTEKFRIGIDDIYVIKGVINRKLESPDGLKIISEGVSHYILFGDGDKILSFFPWETGEHTSFTAF